jgi:hypothetical protein
MEVTAPQIKNGIPSKREWNPLQKVSSIGARSHHTEPRFCFLFGQTFHTAAVHIYGLGVLRQLTAASQIDKSTALIASI